MHKIFKGEHASIHSVTTGRHVARTDPRTWHKLHAAKKAEEGTVTLPGLEYDLRRVVADAILRRMGESPTPQQVTGIVADIVHDMGINGYTVLKLGQPAT